MSRIIFIRAEIDYNHKLFPDSHPETRNYVFIDRLKVYQNTPLANNPQQEQQRQPQRPTLLQRIRGLLPKSP